MSTMIHDLVGVGFGPANLALAAALAEERPDFKALFFERNAEFAWHPGMLLHGARLQVSFLKDLVTLRNPSSNLSFLAFLHETGRLEEFANLRTFFPGRIEYNHYLGWAARRLSRYVRYSHDVVSIRPHRAQPDDVLDIDVLDKNTQTVATVSTRNVVVAPGIRPKWPRNVNVPATTRRIFHSSQYADCHGALSALEPTPDRFVVVGGGQSAAEIVIDLHSRFPNATITCVHGGYGFKPADDSHFVNELFFTSTVSRFFDAPASTRQEILQRHADTNYGVADIDLIAQLYQTRYDDSVSGMCRLDFRHMTTLTDVSEDENVVTLEVLDKLTDRRVRIAADFVVMATGYETGVPEHLIDGLRGVLTSDQGGKPVIGRNYRARTQRGMRAGIYFATGNEQTHGFSDSLLSVQAVRAAEIMNGMSTPAVGASRGYGYNKADSKAIPA